MEHCNERQQGAHFSQRIQNVGPERRVRAVRRQHMQLQVLLINHDRGNGGEGIHIHLHRTYECIINVLHSCLTLSKQPSTVLHTVSLQGH